MGAQLAPATTMTKQKLSFATINVKEAGYVFVYLSYDNSSNNWVYFDDFKITHTPTNVIQYNEYYPFGLQTSNSWTREGNVNDYLYNAGSELNGNSGWYETFFRGYDPVLGRFMQVDPMSSALPSHSPYNFALNDPVYFNDPNGDYVQKRIPPMYVGRGLNDIFGAAGGRGSLNSWIGQYRTSMYMSAGDFINQALNNSQYGGSWSGGQAHFFASDGQAFMAGADYVESHQAWGNTDYGSYAGSVAAFQYIKEYAVIPSRSEVTSILKPTQGTPYLSREQLIELFRDNFNKEWWDPLKANINSGSYTARDVI